MAREFHPEVFFEETLAYRDQTMCRCNIAFGSLTSFRKLLAIHKSSLCPIRFYYGGKYL